MQNPQPPHPDHKWLTQDDPNGQDAALTAQFVSGVVEGMLIDTLNEDVSADDEEAMMRLKANVQVETLGRLQAMQDKADRAMIYQVGQIVADDIYHYAEGEPETISEMLAAALDGIESGSSQWYDLTFIADELIPFMIHNNIPNAAVLWAKGYKKKARSIVPLLRQYFREIKDKKTLEAKVREAIDWVIDPQVSKQDIIKRVNEARGISAPPLAMARETVLPQGRSVITIECTKEQRNTIVRKLKGLIDLHLDDRKPEKGVGI